MNREKELFAQAVELPSAKEREAFLKGACAGDAAMLERVRRLLRAHDEPGAFLPEAPSQAATLQGPAAPAPTITEKPGDAIGRYKLLQQIGEGGCGVVYMAEQEEPVRRRVALKVIKLGMDTKSVIARFEAERQALALMDHPNIAKVLDAGATETGRPYFVMELVRGIRLTEYCDQHKLGVRERLGLFVPVCQAIQHAHQKGIIHRDIKPSNILITLHDGVPVPKVIDFGIAKATDQKLTDKTLFTQYDSFIGTPAYMSPEQAEMSGLDIDTRSDIYSLGVLLYELLTGVTPFNPKTLLQSGIDEMRRMIREDEPPRPSTRLSTLEAKDGGELAKHHQEKLPALINLVRGDLDWIVMKCLEKDRQRRYETANGLAMDIERHLGNEPIVARPPSATYRFQKMVRRNKLAFAAAAAVFAALLAGLGVSTWMYFKQLAAYRQAQAAEAAASTEAARSEQVALFLRSMLKGVGPSVAKGQDTKMLREILDRTAQRLDTDLKGQPDVESTLRFAIGDVYIQLNEHVQAERILRPNLDLTRQNPRYAAHAAYSLAVAVVGQKRLDEAEQLFRQALEGQRKLDGNEGKFVANALEGLGSVFQQQGRLREAETNFLESMAIDSRILGFAETDSAWTVLNLASVVAAQGRSGESESFHRKAMLLLIQKHGKESLQAAEAMQSLGGVLRTRNRAPEAEALFREALDITRRLLGEAHPTVSHDIYRLADFLDSLGRETEAEALFRDTLARQRKAGGPQHPVVADTLSYLGLFHLNHSRFADAEAQHQEALKIRLEVFGHDHPSVAAALGDLGMMYRRWEKLTNAELALKEAVAIGRMPRLNQDDELVRNLLNLGCVLSDQNKRAEAEAAFREALATARRVYGESYWRIALALESIGSELTLQERIPEADAVLTEALAMARKINNTPRIISILGRLGNIAARRKDFIKAESLYREALSLRRERRGNEGETISHLDAMGWALQHQGRLAEAESFYRDAVSLAEQQPSTSLRNKGRRAFQNLFDLLVRQQRWADAQPVARSIVQLSRDVPSTTPNALEDSLYDLARTLDRQDKFAEAESAYRERLASLRQRHSTTNDKVLKTIARLGRCLSERALTERTAPAALDIAREGELLLRQCLVVREGNTNTGRGDLGDARSRLAGARFSIAMCEPALSSESRLARFPEIESMLLNGQQLMAQSSKPDADHQRDSFRRLIRLYESWDRLAPNSGKATQANDWKIKLEAFEQAQVQAPEGQVPDPELQ